LAREKISVRTPRKSSSHRAVIVLDFANACIRVNGFRGEKRDWVFLPKTAKIQWCQILPFVRADCPHAGQEVKRKSPKGGRVSVKSQKIAKKAVDGLSRSLQSRSKLVESPSSYP
jgi:hypothetical protein